MSDYNGWSSYETWNVALWLDNDEGTQGYMVDLAQEMRDDHVSVLAESIRAYVEEQAPDLGASMFADLLGAALSSVNWREIAEHYLADLPEQETEDEDA